MEEKLSCRFYENQYPDVDDLVVVKVIQVLENGAYVQLLEYNNIEGMITPNEYTKVIFQAQQAHLRSINKAIKVGRQEVVQVLKVDKKNGYIDLSKKRVQVSQFKEAEDRYAIAKQVFLSTQVNQILYTVVLNILNQQNPEKQDITITELYEKLVWPLQIQHPKTGILDLFKNALMDPEKLFKNIDISQEIKQKIHQEIKKRLAPKEIKIRTDFELKCFTFEGIESIKYALKQGQKTSDDNFKIKIQVKSAPHYFAFVQCFDKQQGINILENCLEEIEKCIIEKGGKFQIVNKPRVTGEKEEEQLLIKELDRQEESDSDENESDDMGCLEDEKHL